MATRNHKKGERLQIDNLEPRVCLSATAQALPTMPAQGGYIPQSDVNYLPSWQIGSQQVSQSSQIQNPAWLPGSDLLPSQTQQGSQVGQTSQNLPGMNTPVFTPAVTGDLAVVQTPALPQTQTPAFPQTETPAFPQTEIPSFAPGAVQNVQTISLPQNAGSMYPVVSQQGSQFPTANVGSASTLPLIVDDSLHNVAMDIQHQLDQQAISQMPQGANNNLIAAPQPIQTGAATTPVANPVFGPQYGPQSSPQYGF